MQDVRNFSPSVGSINFRVCLFQTNGNQTGNRTQRISINTYAQQTLVDKAHSYVYNSAPRHGYLIVAWIHEKIADTTWESFRYRRIFGFPCSPLPPAPLMPQVSFGKQRSSRLFRFYLSSTAPPFSLASRLSSPNALSGRRFLPPPTPPEIRRRPNIKLLPFVRTDNGRSRFRRSRYNLYSPRL